MHRLRQELRRRLRRLSHSGIPIAQCALAAGAAWLLAVHVVGHPRPFFAPIAAVISLGISLGQRLRRVVELVVGVSIGIGVGDVLISLIGTGALQIMLVVALAMSTAVFMGSGTVITLQAASSAVLVATLLPPETAGGFARMLDAAVGGLVGIIVAALLPANPLTVAHRQGRHVFGALSEALRGVARATRQRDIQLESEVLAKARDSQQTVDEFRSALQAGSEIARIAPSRWHHRGELARYKRASVPVDRALRNTRVLARRALTALRDEESVPAQLPELLDQLADAVLTLRDELAAGVVPMRAREAIQQAGCAITVELLSEEDFSMHVVIAQLRSLTVDLLQATGMGRSEAIAVLPPSH